MAINKFSALFFSILFIVFWNEVFGQSKRIVQAKILIIDSTSLPLYYWYILKVVKDDSLIEVIVEKDRRIKVMNCKYLHANKTYTINLFKVDVFSMKNGSNHRIGLLPIGIQKLNGEMFRLNRYGGVYSTYQLFGPYFIE